MADAASSHEDETRIQIGLAGRQSVRWCAIEGLADARSCPKRPPPQTRQSPQGARVRGGLAQRLQRAFAMDALADVDRRVHAARR